MISEKYELHTEVVASEDMRKTYEIRRKWNDFGGKAICIELYPTISADRAGELDSSTMHLLNHMKDFEYGSISVLNIYSTVFENKPMAKDLSEDVENLAYMEDVFERSDIADYDILIAWGSSLVTHRTTAEAKLDILTMLKSKGLEEQVKCIVPEYVDDDSSQGKHPLFLGLRYGKDVWSLEDFNIDAAIAELEKLLNEKTAKESKSKTASKGTGKKTRKKTVKDEQKDISQDEVTEDNNETDDTAEAS